MRNTGHPSHTMTHISMKIGRFMCDPAVEVDGPNAFARTFRCNEDDDGKEVDDDDVTAPSRTHSSSNLHNYFHLNSRKFSLPDFQIRGFEYDGQEQEVRLEGEMDSDDSSGCDALPWRRDYNRTLCPYENDRILHLLNRVVHQKDNDSQDGRDGEAEVEDMESPVIPLPWRSEEAMVALEDSSKYLKESEDFGEATPHVKDNDEGHPLASFCQSSPSSSIRNIPSSFDDAPRPDLSACQSLSLSHWLSEAESRHSEPFCLPHQHHHSASPAEPSSMRSSLVGLRCSRPQDHHHRHPRQQEHSGSSSSSSSRYLVPSFIPDEEDGVGVQSQLDQVRQWLMENDVESTAKLDEADDQHPTSGLLTDRH